jgi:ABC-type glycerol-3-phosphate transport system substrate-binding protein
MSRLLATHAAAMCAMASVALGDSTGWVGGGLSNSERKRIRDRNAVHPNVEIAGDNLPGETNRQFAARMKAARDEQGQSE